MLLRIEAKVCMMVHRAPRIFQRPSSLTFSPRFTHCPVCSTILAAALFSTHPGVTQDQNPGCFLDLDHALAILIQFNLSPLRGLQIMLVWPKVVVSQDMGLPVLKPGQSRANQATGHHSSIKCHCLSERVCEQVLRLDM